MYAAFDFTLHAAKSKMCDFRVGSGVSVMDCGTFFTTFNTDAALKGKGKLQIQKLEGKVSFFQRYGDYGYGSGW
jgi:flagellar hook protein FlgE